MIDLQTRGHDEQAAKEYQRAVSTGLDHPAAHYNLGLLLKNQKDYDEAHKHLIAALGHPELDLGTNLVLGRLARMRDDIQEAARHLIQALKLADALSVDQSQSAQLNRLYDTILASQSEVEEDELANIVENTLKFLSGPNWFKILKDAREKVRKDENWENSITRILYRPFDIQWIFYQEVVIERARKEVMRHMMQENYVTFLNKGSKSP